jgi:cytochrome c556
MAATYYKYAERDADSQVNWAEVGKGLSDMLAETNRVRQEKRDALDTAQRETMNYLAETPNGEHVGARKSILKYADKASNQMRIWDNLLKNGQLDPKDYTINRQQLTDGTNLAFNANKLYQENYADVMKGVADKTYSQLTAENYAEAEVFANWGDISWEIGPDGTVMVGKLIEQEIDGKKVRTLDKTPGGLRSMDYLNQALVSKIDFYNYEDKVNAWVETLGKEKKVTTLLGKIQKQGKITSVDDITSRKDIDPSNQEILFTFLQGENDQIASIVGEPFDAARVLVDSAIFAPNKQQYRSTTSEEDAKKNPEAILKVVDTDSGGFKYVISKEQQEDANEFVRGQMRAKYNYEEDAQVVGAVSRDPESEEAIKRKAEQKEKDNALGTWGDAFKANTPAGKRAAIEAILGSKLAQDRGLLDIDLESQPGKIIFKYADAVKNRTLNYDPNTTTLRQWNELGNEVHGIDNVAEVMKRNKGGDPNMRMGASQRNFAGVKVGRTPVKDAVVEFDNKIKSVPANIFKGSDKDAAVKLTNLLKGTNIVVKPNLGLNPYQSVNLSYKGKNKVITFNDPLKDNDPETLKQEFESWVNEVVSAEDKEDLLKKGVTGGQTGELD